MRAGSALGPAPARLGRPVCGSCAACEPDVSHPVPAVRDERGAARDRRYASRRGRRAIRAHMRANGNDLGRQGGGEGARAGRSEEHTSELQSLMRISYAVFCLKKKTHINKSKYTKQTYDLT